MTQPAPRRFFLRTGQLPPRRAFLFALPFALLLALALWWHAHGSLSMGDDPTFAAALGWLSLPSWLAQRWLTWTSRLLLEIPLVLVARSPAAFGLWIGIDCACLLAIAASLTLISRRPTPTHAAVACTATALLWLTAPMDSGYLTMSAVYLWPMAALCLCLLPLLNDKRPSWKAFVFGLLCCVYAANNEQFCVLLLLIFAAALLVRQRRTEKPLVTYPAAALAVCVILLGTHLLCPGNAARKVANYEWFVDYDMLTFPQRLEMGISGTMSGMFLTPALSWGLFFLLLAGAGLFCLQSVWERIFCCVPAVAWLVLGVLPQQLPAPLRQMLTLSTRLTQHGSVTLENHSNPFSYLFPALMITLAFCVLAAVYLVLGHTPRAGVALGLLLAGFAARMTLIVSPSIWVSGSRTHLILNLCCNVVCLLLIDTMIARKKQSRVTVRPA